MSNRCPIDPILRSVLKTFQFFRIAKLIRNLNGENRVEPPLWQRFSSHHNKVREFKEFFVFPPCGDLLEGFGADDKEECIVWKILTGLAESFNGKGTASFPNLDIRCFEVGIPFGGDTDHLAPIFCRRQLFRLFVGGHSGGDEDDSI